MLEDIMETYQTEMWRDNPSINFPNFSAGTKGPETAEALIATDGSN
jgi:hypothetical protein